MAYRGGVRKCACSSCSPCDLYLITSDRKGIKDMLGEIFPDSRVLDWKPIKGPLTEKQQKALDYQEKRLKEPPSDRHWVATFKEVMRDIGVSDKDNLWKNT